MGGAHAEQELAAFCEGLLSEAEALRVEAHLAECESCRAAETQLRRGLDLARRIEPTPLPEEQASRIRRALAEAAAAAPGRGRPWRRAAAAAAVVAALVAARLVAPGRAVDPVTPTPAPPGSLGPSLHVDPGPPTHFEQAALDLHAAHAEGRLTLDLRSSSAAEVRRWTERTAGVGVNLAVERPPEDAGRFALEGARTIRIGALKAVAVAYRVDGRPVTLLTARADAALERMPEWTPGGKRVRFRAAGGRKLLAWTNSGQTYALVSDLPDYGQRSCLLCHTAPERRESIRKLGPPAGP